MGAKRERPDTRERGARCTDERRLNDGLQRDALELIDAIPRRLRPALVKDVRLQFVGAFVAQRLQRPAALGRVRFLHEDERLALLERRADLAEAVLVARAERRVSRGECRGRAPAALGRRGRGALRWGGVAGRRASAGERK